MQQHTHTIHVTPTSLLKHVDAHGREFNATCGVHSTPACAWVKEGPTTPATKQHTCHPPHCAGPAMHPGRPSTTRPGTPPARTTPTRPSSRTCLGGVVGWSTTYRLVGVHNIYHRRQIAYIYNMSREKITYHNNLSSPREQQEMARHRRA